MSIQDILSPSQSRASAREAGFTLIEVIVAALILAIVSGAAATAIISAMHASGNTRIRAEAQALAEQNQDTLRGLNVDQLSNLNQTISKTVNGTQFSVKESASYVSDASGTPSCSNPSADYLQTTSTVSWNDMNGNAPVSATSLLTPTIGSVDPTHGTLAVSVTNAALAGVAGVNVTVSGPTSASGQTASNGCELFGDLPASPNYTVSVWPASGNDVDGTTGQLVNASTPDTATAQVSAGSTASGSSPFVLDSPGTAAVSFKDAFPASVSPTAQPASTPTAPAVVFSESAMSGPRVCSPADAGSTCPAVGSGRTSFPSSAWQGANGTVAAWPLYPYTYAAYAGVCSNDDPSLYKGSDVSVTVTAGNTSSVSLTLPAMVVRLYSGTNTSSSEIPVPAGASLVVTDTGCGMHYIGTNPAVQTVASGQAVLPLNTTYGAGNADTGLLTYPGMPWGAYSVCYTDPAGKVYESTAFTNQGSGEIVNLFAGSTTTGSCS